MDWSTLDGGNLAGSLFVNCMLDNFLVQCVNGPTRSGNILDLVFTNSQEIEGLNIGENLGNSDHQVIRFSTVGKRDIEGNATMVPDWGRGNYVYFRELLGKIDWNREFLGLDTHQMWDHFKNILSSFQNLCIPTRNIRNGVQKPRWWNDDVRKLICAKHTAFARLKEKGGRAEFTGELGMI